MREARAAAVPLDRAQRERLARARAALTVADLLATPGQRAAPDVSDTHGAELAWTMYQTALRHVVAAMLRRGDEADADLAALKLCAGSADVDDALLRRITRNRPTDEDPELCAADIARVHRLAHALCDAMDPRRHRIPRLWGERIVRTGLAAALAIALVVAAPVVDVLRRPELALGARWTASSAAMYFGTEGQGFAPPREGPLVFVHTAQESSPWVRFDLGAAKALRNVITYNRWDCCVERAVPLVVELSLDGEHYWEAATRRDPFYVWSATFAAQRARYVRLRVLGPSTLHLTRVEIR